MHISHKNDRFQKHCATGARMLLAITFLAIPAVHGEPQAGSPETAARCGPEGRLAVDLYGGIRTRLDWSAADLECEGMPRPNGAGARLLFSGNTELGGKMRQIAIIISLPELKRGETVKETPANVTIMEHYGGRFFSSTDASYCLSDIDEQTHRAGTGRDDYVISGILYCVAALAELNGSGSVSLTDLTFSGQLDWHVPE